MAFKESSCLVTEQKKLPLDWVVFVRVEMASSHGPLRPINSARELFSHFLLQDVYSTIKTALFRIIITQMHVYILHLYFTITSVHVQE